MKKNFVTFALLTSLILSSCNMPANLKITVTPTQDAVSTQVSQILTQQPSATAKLPTAALPTLAPSSTPLPVDTLSPTFTPPPSASSTSIPGDPRTSLGQPTWQDNFESAKNFYLYSNDNTKIDFTPGAIVLTGITANGWHGWTLTYSHSTSNFYLEETFKVGDCAGSDLYGMIFRASKENTAYFFGATCDGHYNLHARDFNNNTDTTLIDPKETASIVQGSGQTNRLGVMAQGSKISLYANGHLLEEISDSTYTGGYFGPFIAANKTANFTVQMTQISLWKQN
jgi:hypothetical protein